jgi:hypothetical protein
MPTQTQDAKTMSDVDLYQSELPPTQREIVKAVRALMARRYPELTESLKWHVPTYSLNSKNLLGLQDFKNHVNLNFFKGSRLHDPKGVLKGTGKQVRHVTFRAVDQIDRATLKALIDQTIANERGRQE